MTNNINDDFLDLLEKPLDDAQTRALKVNRNAVIAAGAGSGKTQVLATRFSWLIMTGQAKVDEILTLTFTNKAASEMYQRIYKSLSYFANYKESEKLTKENRRLAQEALDSFSNAHIQTLDSYCGGIVRQCANRYGIKPDFTTGSSDSSSDIKSKAFKFVMDHKENTGIQTFADPGKIQEFSDSIFASTIEKYTSLATEKYYFVNKLEIQRKEIVQAWNYYFLGKSSNSDLILSDIKSLKNQMSELSDVLNASDKKDDIKKADYVKTIISLFDKTSDILNKESITEEDIINNTDRLKDSINAAEEIMSSIVSAASKSGYIKEVRSAVIKVRNEFNPLLSSLAVYLKQYNAIYQLNILFDDFLKEINSAKRTSGNLSFNDVTSMALKILLENEDIRNQEKNSFKKIMIDEFQDNNGKNRDLLYILSLKEGELENNGNYIIKPDESNNLISLIIERNEKGEIINDKRSENKLFFVGDEKQSIYKFRGADVSVFNELTKDNENELISMTYNYRSTPELLSSFNSMFKGGNYIFETTLNKKDYEAYYEKDALKNGMELPALNKENVPVHMNLLNSKRFSDVKDAYDFIPKKDQLAYFMAKKIYETGKKEGNWNNIAILDRSRSDRNNITKYLSMFDIPYEVDQFNNIFQDGIVNDFYNFFRICVYPSDINAYGAYLTSPFCGLSVSSGAIILSHLIDYSNKKNISFTPFPEIKADSDGHISEIDKEIEEDITKEEFEKYITGKSYFQDNRNSVLQQKITTTLSNLWHKKGYKYETLLSQQTELAAEHFDMIFELGRQAESSGKSVSWFVDQLELLKASFTSQDADIDAKGLTYPLERKEAVQIMTIHKSKGLQFDHVFIYGCLENRSKSENATIFFNEKYGVSIRPENGSQNYFFLKEADLFKAKEAAEFRRLIYVAITRAIKDVNIIGAWNPETTSTSQLHMLENATLKFYQDFGEKNQFNEECGFDYNEIEPVEYSQLPIVSRDSTDFLRKKAIENTEKLYEEQAELIKYECHAVERKTPSSLEPDFIEKADKDSGAKYEEASDILISSNFSAADFGTLVHAYLEAQANNIDPELFEPPVSLFKNLSNNKIEEAKKECINFSNQFRKSSLGTALDKAKNNKDFYRAEWGFRMVYENAIFTGSIDLIYSNGDGTYTIVDYKSDNSVEPDKYIGQQHCYRTAASKLLNVDEDKISLYLYFLKHDKIVPLD